MVEGWQTHCGRATEKQLKGDRRGASASLKQGAETRYHCVNLIFYFFSKVDFSVSLEPTGYFSIYSYIVLLGDSSHEVKHRYFG